MANKEGFFKAGNQHGFIRQKARKLDPKPICFKPFEGQRDAAQKVPDLADKLRAALETIILDSAI